MIQAGMDFTVHKLVEQKDLASALGSGRVDVFATPLMIALMELAASECIQPELEEGQVSVGTAVDIRHTNPTPAGARVWARAQVEAVDGRQVNFSLRAWDEVGEIGLGTHSRFIVDKEKFEKRAMEKTGTA